MRLLPDTCSFLWTLRDPKRLSSTARRTLQKAESEMFVSVVSFWENSINSAVGQLPLGGGGPEDMPHFVVSVSFTVTTLTSDVAATTAQLT